MAVRKEDYVEKYKISIVVPVYNTEAYLHRCVDSLLGQTYKNTEILLVDDGSTDGSGQVCDELAKNEAKIKVLHKENGGLISAWKQGVFLSQGDYLCFVDSDDWVEPVMISEMAAYLTGSAEEIIASDYVIERGEGNQEYVYQQLEPGEYDRSRLEKEVVPHLLGREKRYVTMSRCMKLIARELIVKNCHYSDERIRMGEDVTVMLPALLDCSRLVVMNHRVYYHYFYVTDSMVHKYDAGMYENCRLLRQVVLNILKDKFHGGQLKEMSHRADQEYLFLLLLVLKNEARGNKEQYLSRILKIFREEEIRELAAGTPIEVRQMANRLLYLVLRYPNQVTVRLLRLAMILYYR